MSKPADRRRLSAFLAGIAVSRAGDAAELIALNWVAYAATGQASSVALLTAARLLPLFAATPIAGWLADRYRAETLLAALLTVGGLGTAVAAVVAARVDALGLGWLVAVVAVRSTITGPDPVLRQLCLARLVAVDQVPRVFALHSLVLTLSLVIGPALATPALALGRPWWVVAGNAGSSLIFGIVVLWIRRALAPAQPAGPTPPAPALRSVLRGERRLGRQLMLAIGPMLFVFPYTSLLPVISGAGLGRGAALTGLLATIAAAGAVLAAVLLIRWPPADPAALAGRAAYALVAAVLLLAAALAIPDPVRIPLACAALFAIGALGQSYRTSNRTALLLLAPEAARGRVLGVASLDRVLIPLGAAGVSLLIDRTGVGSGVTAMGLAAGLCVVLATWPLARR